MTWDLGLGPGTGTGTGTWVWDLGPRDWDLGLGMGPGTAIWQSQCSPSVQVRVSIWVKNDYMYSLLLPAW